MGGAAAQTVPSTYSCSAGWLNCGSNFLLSIHLHFFFFSFAALELALLLWRFLPTEGDPGWAGLEVAEVVAGRPEEEEPEDGPCCWDTFCNSAASCLGSTPGDRGGLSPGQRVRESSISQFIQGAKHT